MKCYELPAEETEEALIFRNSMFSFVAPDHWEAMRCTGVIARAEADDADQIGSQAATRIVGFIPLQFRMQTLRPGLAVPVVYENAVGVDERFRSKGIGAKMIETAADFVSDRADALFVIRGGESSDGYRFYRKTGHSDLCHAVSQTIEVAPPPDSPSGVREVDRAEWLQSESRLNELYSARFGAFGGGRVRESGYWTEILDGHVFKARKWRLLMASPLKAGDEERISGYAVVVRGTWQNLENEHLYEINAEDDQTAIRLIAASADPDHLPIRVPSVSLDNPIRRVLGQLGFVETKTDPQIMARIIAPTRLFGRLAAGTESLPSWWQGVHVVCSTPHRSFDLKPARTAGRTVHLEMKEHLLARMLCCRLDVEAAFTNDLIRSHDADQHVVSTLARICRPAPWVQWFTDYV